MANLRALYDEDFVRWTEQQAAALRRAKSSDLPLDWENLAEEIESLGKSDRRELRSQITRILRHLLKLEVSPAAEPRAGWRAMIREARSEIEGVLEDSPSLWREARAMIPSRSVLPRSWRRMISDSTASPPTRCGSGSAWGITQWSRSSETGLRPNPADLTGAGAARRSSRGNHDLRARGSSARGSVRAR